MSGIEPGSDVYKESVLPATLTLGPFVPRLLLPLGAPLSWYTCFTIVSESQGICSYKSGQQESGLTVLPACVRHMRAKLLFLFETPVPKWNQFHLLMEKLRVQKRM